MTEQPKITLQEELVRLANGLEASSKQLADMSTYLSRVVDMVRQGAVQAAPPPPHPQQVEINQIVAAYANQARRLCATLQMPEDARVDDVFNVANDLLGRMLQAPAGENVDATQPTIAEATEWVSPEPETLPTPVQDEAATREMLMAAILKDWQLGLLRTYLSPATWPNGTGVVRHQKGTLEKYQEDILKVDFRNLFKWPMGFYVSSENGATQLMLRQNDVVIIIGDLSTIATVPLVIFRHQNEGQAPGFVANRLDELDDVQYQATYAVAKDVLEELTAKM